MNEPQKNFLMRDTDQTKTFLWTAYDGVTYYYQEAYLTEEPTLIALIGFKRWIKEFYYQIKYLYQQFDQITKEDITKFLAVVNKDKHELNKNDFETARDFCEKFMYESGLKKIVYKEKNPGDSVLENR